MNKVSKEQINKVTEAIIKLLWEKSPMVIVLIALQFRDKLKRERSQP